MSLESSAQTLILAAPNAIQLELATGLLEGAGIPTITHGQDRDLAEFGQAFHNVVARPDLYVPLAAFEKARRVLIEAMGEEIEGLAPSSKPQ